MHQQEHLDRHGGRREFTSASTHHDFHLGRISQWWDRWRISPWEDRWDLLEMEQD